MATRGRSSLGNDGDGERSSKRHRTGGDAEDSNGDGTPAPSLENLNRDCLRLIFSYISGTDDLNSFAICSRSCRRARADPSLDQTRTGTIVLSQGSTFDSLCDAISKKRWSRVFRGNQTKLKMVGFEFLPSFLHDARSRVSFSNLYLNTVTHLQFVSSDPSRSVIDKVLCNFLHLLPNLIEMDFGSTRLSHDGLLEVMHRNTFCQKLERLHWTGPRNPIDASGYPFSHIWFRLTVLSLDGANFGPLYADSGVALFYTRTDYVLSDRFLMSGCNNLARLSIKNCTWRERGQNEIVPMPQEVLIKMVRNHPTLRWLRSDLSEENVAMLQAERPEITLVSD